MTTERPPIIALAQFFDDIRVEVTGKAILIGQYASYMVLSPGMMPVDRLAVLLTVRWPRDYIPREMGMKIDVPGQLPLVYPLPAPSPPDFTNKPLSPFAGVMMQAVLQLRSLRASGDFDQYWAFHLQQEYERNHQRRYQRPARKQKINRYL